MDLQFELNREQCIIPSQAHFGHRGILLHTAQNSSSGKPQQILRVQFNSQYASRQWLCEKISEETYHLSRDLKQAQFSEEECLAYSTRRILKHIVKDADEGGMYLQHKILYLTFKHLLYLVSKRAAKKNVQIGSQVGLQEWLADVDALFFKQEAQGSALQGFGSEEELFENLRRKDYEAMLANLQHLGASQTQSSRKQKVQLLTKMLIVKIETQQNECSNSSRSQQVKMANRLTLAAIQRQCQEAFKQEKGRRMNVRQQQRDYLQIVGQVLMGNYECIKCLVKDSWPLFLTHVLDMQSEQHQLSYQHLKAQVKSFLNLRNKDTAVTLPKQSEYLLSLLGGRNLHMIYQYLFDLVSPFYCHLIAYFTYYFYEATPLLVLMRADYMGDLVRSLLEQSSQVSHLCLFLTYGLVENNEMVERKGEMIEPLLYYHLSVADLDDREQIQLFWKKVATLNVLSLQRLAYSHFRTLMIRFFENDVLSQMVVESYLHYSAIFGKQASYQFDLPAFAELYFSSSTLSAVTIQQIVKVGQKLKGRKQYRKQYRQFEKIRPLFDKFILLNQAHQQQSFDRKIAIALALMKVTVRSLPLARLIHQIVSQQTMASSNGLWNNLSQAQFSSYQQFLISVRRYIDHYPKSRPSSQDALIRSIDAAIGS